MAFRSASWVVTDEKYSSALAKRRAGVLWSWMVAMSLMLTLLEC